jgi:hypothetical protein
LSEDKHDKEEEDEKAQEERSFEAWANRIQAELLAVVARERREQDQKYQEAVEKGLSKYVQRRQSGFIWHLAEEKGVAPPQWHQRQVTGLRTKAGNWCFSDAGTMLLGTASNRDLGTEPVCRFEQALHFVRPSPSDVSAQGGAVTVSNAET